MEQQQFVGIGRAEHAFGETMESALDGLLDFEKGSAHFAARLTISDAAGAAEAPP
jgi:hypothetical protein